MLPPEVAQAGVHSRPVRGVAPHAVDGGAVARGVAEDVAVRAVEDRHQALRLWHVVPRHARVRHRVQRVALVPGALDLQHARRRRRRRFLVVALGALGVFGRRAGDEAVRGGAQPELRFVRGQNPEQHVRDVRAGQALVRLHGLVLARGAPLGGVVPGEGRGQTQLLLPQRHAPAAPEPQRVAERRGGQARGAQRVPRLAALLLQRERAHETADMSVCHDTGIPRSVRVERRRRVVVRLFSRVAHLARLGALPGVLPQRTLPALGVVYAALAAGPLGLLAPRRRRARVGGSPRGSRGGSLGSARLRGRTDGARGGDVVFFRTRRLSLFARHLTIRCLPRRLPRVRGVQEVLRLRHKVRALRRRELAVARKARRHRGVPSVAAPARGQNLAEARELVRGVLAEQRARAAHVAVAARLLELERLQRAPDALADVRDPPRRFPAGRKHGGWCVVVSVRRRGASRGVLRVHGARRETTRAPARRGRP